MSFIDKPIIHVNKSQHTLDKSDDVSNNEGLEKVVSGIGQKIITEKLANFGFGDTFSSIAGSLFGRTMTISEAKDEVAAAVAFEKITLLEDLCAELNQLETVSNPNAWEEAFKKAIKKHPQLKNVIKFSPSFIALALKLNDSSFRNSLSGKDACSVLDGLNKELANIQKKESSNRIDIITQVTQKIQSKCETAQSGVESKNKPIFNHFFLELINSNLSGDQIDQIGKALIQLVSENPKEALADLQSLTNLLSVFGEDILDQCLVAVSNQNPREKNAFETFFLKQLQPYLKTDEASFEKAFPSLEEKHAFRTLLEKISKLSDNKKTEANKLLNQYVGVMMKQSSPSIESAKKSLDPNLLAMAARFLSLEDHGYCEDPSFFSPEYLRQANADAREFNKNYLTLQFKRISHIFHLKGDVQLPDGTRLNLERSHATYMVPMLWERFNEFAPTRKDLVSDKMFDTMTNAFSKAVCDGNNPDEKITKLHETILNSPFEPIMLETGFKEHSIQTVFFRDHLGNLYFADCNRGEESEPKPGIVFYRIPNENKKKVTPELLKRLTNTMSADKSTYTSRNKLVEELGAEEIAYIPMKEQKVGNCTYASAKAAIQAIAIIAQLGENSSQITSQIQSIPDDIRNRAKEFSGAFSKSEEKTITRQFQQDLEQVNIGIVHVKGGKEYIDGLNEASKKLRVQQREKMRRKMDKKEITKVADFKDDALKQRIEMTEIFSEKVKILTQLHTLLQNT